MGVVLVVQAALLMWRCEAQITTASTTRKDPDKPGQNHQKMGGEG